MRGPCRASISVVAVFAIYMPSSRIFWFTEYFRRANARMPWWAIRCRDELKTPMEVAS